jgi:anti-sigma regulatory factor (Ser/Thr protein kinase)
LRVTWEYTLVSCEDSPAEARAHVRDALTPYADRDTLDRVELVVSELVTNSVRHGPGKPITLRLATASGDAIWGEVADEGDGVVAIRRQQLPSMTGGLGLPIVDSLASDWGVYPGSTHVWFRFAA